MVALGEAEAGFDLEAMRKEDSSWHPCQVSLSSTGVGLIICFESGELEDVELNSEGALACLRFRSIPLEGDDCSDMKQGEHVLAADKSKSKSLFYDAEVDEVVRVKHSKRVFCRCTFVIKWLHHDINGETLTVPSSSIMRLATKSINLHPTVGRFLKMIGDIDSPASAPFSTVPEDFNSEIDLNMLIDQQIEQITNAVDASQGIARDILLGVKVDVEGQIQPKRNSSDVKVDNDQNHFRRSTRSSKKSVADEDAPAPAPSSTQEKHEKMSQLSPLAARALLASFTAMNGTRLSDFLTNDELYEKTNLCSRMPTASIPVKEEPVNLLKQHVPKSQLPEPSSETLTCSIAEKKLSQTIRVTRSTINTGTPTSNVRRLTRSAIREEKEVEVGLEEEHISTSITNPVFSEKSNSVSRKKKPASSVVDAEMSIPSRQWNKRQISDTVETCQQTEGYVAEVMTLTAAAAKPGRLTRSAVREGKEILTMEVGKGQEETSNAAETPKQNEGTGTSSRSQKRKSVSSCKQERRFSPRNHSRNGPQ